LVNPVDARRAGTHLASGYRIDHRSTEEVSAMYVVVLHDILEPEAAFARGQRLIDGDGVPEGVRVLQFYPSRDSTKVTCLWEASTMKTVQAYVDETMGDSSHNTWYEVNDEQAFAERPLGLHAAAAG
jgi:hypothetical protein